MQKFISLCFCFILSVWLEASADNILFLKDNLQRAQPGDYIVTASNKTYTVLHIYGKKDNALTIEEITIPEQRVTLNSMNWRSWVQQNAPYNTSWVMYEINLQTGQMSSYYSFTKNGWYDIPQAENFLSTLVNLRLVKVPMEDRRKVGPPPDLFGPDHRTIWQPHLVVDGKEIRGVQFDAWKTRWPRDGSDLAGRVIEVFVPVENEKYPSYFPYWLQISGIIGKAKIRIIDSGTGLTSPKPSLEDLKKL